MANKNSRAGGKYTGNHVTLTAEAAAVADVAARDPLCTKISPANITGGLRGVQGKKRLKLKVVSATCIEATVRGNKAVQILYLYATEADTLPLLQNYLEKETAKLGFALS